VRLHPTIKRRAPAGLSRGFTEAALHRASVKLLFPESDNIRIFTDIFQ
jgi:hypothetical protein